jgi:Flp pilus assembly protein TadD
MTAHLSDSFALYGAARFDEALALLAPALADPQADAATLNLAAACAFALKRLSDAEAYWRRAAARDPACADAHSNLGIVLRMAGRLSEAEAACLRALELAPDLASAHISLGRVYDARHAHEAALNAYSRAIECNPRDAAAHLNAGSVCMTLDRFGEAEAAFRHALMLDPGLVAAHFNHGAALKKLSRFDDAEAAYRQALSLDPHHVDARLNLAHLLLGMGQWSEGWRLFESRYAPGGWFDPPHTGLPMWRGEPLAGKSLIVWTEQGMGDSLQFCRYLPMLKARGVRTLTFACPRPLLSLFRTLEGVDELVVSDEHTVIAPHDYQCLLMSLPDRFGTTLDNVPALLPYLHAPEDRRRAWQGRLPSGAFRVGLVWAGDPRSHAPHLHAVDRLRSLSAQAYLPILHVPGVTFVSLQKGASTQPQIDTLPAELRPFDCMNDVKDFADTAAIIEQLDLVITVDTSVAHLAGALNRPVWILSRYDGCWRWLYRDVSESVWYPNARLFRQTRRDGWDDVIAAVACALADEARARANA